MSTISNRFYITALEDGTTLHGNLAANKPLNQYWNGTSAYPNWTDPSEQPTIYVTLLSGNTLVAPDNTGSWYYNGTLITGSDSRFLITTMSLTLMEQTVTVPALKIVANLATSANTDVDTITYQGSYSGNGGSIPFSATAQIRISQVTKGSNVGVINFVNGISNITDVGQTITAYGKAFSGDNGEDISGFTVKWYINETEIQSGDTRLTTYTEGSKTFPALSINESDVVDHATIRCVFYKGGELLDTAYAGVDDMQDPEFMYIQNYVQNESRNGNATSLRKGESAPFVVFVGSRDSATVRSGWENAVYKLQLLSATSQIITASGLNNIPNPDTGDTTNYYRTLKKYHSTEPQDDDYTTDPNLVNRAHFEVNYSVPEAYGKNITGIIIAYTS